ncbi:MAG: bifunctional UDP-N-acetylglucosamine diphosphorylase/glucosamine-1-phosphate N-acetyltransferase GlmU [Actinobacteria bacterium]|nr:bifunctional UDP-N-acetylglucosamine diphosphorylase/glucosamine-1-phosphate N-acetyltransferase GlmU [Actinomycetota bacterium]
MAAPVVVILAAGQGTRMRSATPKLLHPLCGRPVIAWSIAAARAAGAQRVVVVGGPDRALEPAVAQLDDPTVVLAVQQEARGTADAVASAREHVERDAPVLVICGDVPLMTGEALRALAQAHAGHRASATMLTMVLDDPSGYGRVVRGPDGAVERVVETKKPGDATPGELEIREVNGGVYAFAGGDLLDALQQVRADNAQGELYLPDVLPILRSQDKVVAAHVVDDPTLALGINDRGDLAKVRALAQQRIHARHMAAGVTIVDPGSTVIDADVEIDADTTVHPFTSIQGATRIGPGCEVGPLTTLVDTTLGAGVRIPHSYATGAEVRDGASVGPFAYLRPNALLRERSKAGTFVEIKNSDIGEGAKVPHLSYVGDADVGAGTNLGASTITANYDGREKHRTTIGANVHGGVHTSLVAPVTVGDDAWIGAGSVITDEVPDGALGIARARQRNLEGYDERLRERADR